MATKIIPAFASVIRNSTGVKQVSNLEQLAILVGIIKQHVRKHMPVVYELIVELWDYAPLQLALATLVEALGKAFDAEFKPFLLTVLPLLLKTFDLHLTDKVCQTQMKILDAFVTFGVGLEEYLQLVIPLIVRTYERMDAPTPLRKRAMQTLQALLLRLNLSDHASRMIHALTRVLREHNNELRTGAMDTLSALLLQMGSDFAVFVPVVQKVSQTADIYRLMLLTYLVSVRHTRLVALPISGGTYCTES